ncbi:M20 metallopeptidase family protein [Bacillus sp. FJAT-45350]|uniref:M20 metallopeptidase family protein n=1 Tax=Bacillus sp. FJAT-45350 TaxID=2011014 RepID=UPI0027B9E854|nr:M20 family metallopeptidase [Bacillus sp. FJAT-45350]
MTVKAAYELQQQLSEWRRHFHQHPELSFQEYKTSEKVISILKKIDGIEVQSGREATGLPTGVVATLRKGNGRTIAIRADIDALPIVEGNSCEYSSQKRGVMHACGHDAHTTIALGAATLLAEAFKKSQIEGTVKFIFQPAEESEDERGLTGSPYMIEAGVLDDVDAVLALHMDPDYKVGNVKIFNGTAMANVDTFTAVIKGRGGHAAYPEQTLDPIWLLSNILPALYSLVGRKTSALSPAVLSIGEVIGGSSNNIIPEEVEIKGTIRTYDDTARKQITKEIDRVLSIVERLGGDYSLLLNHGEPSLQNNPIVSSWVKKTIRDILPGFSIHEKPYGLGGEDFGYMTRKIPGLMFFLGASPGDGRERGLHTPLFDIDEGVLPIGTAIFTETVKRYLQGDYHFPMKER